MSTVKVTFHILSSKNFWNIVASKLLRFLYRKQYVYYPYIYPTPFLLGMLGYNLVELRRNFSLILFMSVVAGTVRAYLVPNNCVRF